jgi:hypothetical protein
MEPAERDIEKASSHSPDDDTTNEEGMEAAGFQPIRTDAAAAASRSASRRSSRTLGSISRTRSQNGWSCDDNSEDEQDSTSIHAPEKDPFEVGFENGDQDPMCPRSMTVLRKWVIVSIVSSASLCV